MTLPAPLVRAVESRFGSIASATPVGGGSISAAVRLALPGGPVFLKYGVDAPAGLFASEARGLEALRGRVEEITIPRVLGLEDDESAARGFRWLALEWLEPGVPTAASQEVLGRGLARLHRAGRAGWGWEHDGFIGALPQENGRAGDWPTFWRDRRLEPQIRLSRDAGRSAGEPREWDRLLARLPELLHAAAEEGASPLHGDLWNGNVLPLADGGAALVDPAFYNGHREVDLAMSELFGGFGASFRSAYEEEWPLLPGYSEVRRAIYQLYYLLVHVNLFGGVYEEQTRRVLRGAMGHA